MRYMLQVRFNGAQAVVDGLAPDEQQAIFTEYAAVGRHPGVLHANQLQATDTAKTVQVKDGESVITDGLPIDQAGALDGYYLYDAPDLQAALALAARIPAARLGGTVEIRPVIER
jgi:hypothetical protein